MGLIGLGNMGTAVAERLLEADFPLVVYNRTPSKAEPLAARGATVAGSPADLARETDVVLTSLSDDDALEVISWEEFFEKFDEADLALLYQEETADGERSNFNKLVGRETAEAREHGDNKTSRHRGR